MNRTKTSSLAEEVAACTMSSLTSSVSRCPLTFVNMIGVSLKASILVPRISYVSLLADKSPKGSNAPQCAKYAWIVTNVDRWCERDMPAMSLISKLAPDRPLPRVTKSYELQFGQLGTSTPEFKCFFLPYILLSRYPLSYVYNHRPVRTSPNQNLKPIETNGRQK